MSGTVEAIGDSSPSIGDVPAQATTDVAAHSPQQMQPLETTTGPTEDVQPTKDGLISGDLEEAEVARKRRRPVVLQKPLAAISTVVCLILWILVLSLFISGVEIKSTEVTRGIRLEFHLFNELLTPPTTQLANLTATLPNWVAPRTKFGHRVGMAAAGHRVFVAMAGSDTNVGAIFIYNSLFADGEGDFELEDIVASVENEPDDSLDPIVIREQAVDMSADGSHLVFSQAGKVYAYFRSGGLGGGGWQPISNTPVVEFFSAPDEPVVYPLDVSISADGTVVAIMTHEGLDSSEVYIFTLSEKISNSAGPNDSWTLSFRIELLGESGTVSLSWDGKRLAIGEHASSSKSTTASLSVYEVNESNPTRWEPMGNVMDGIGVPLEQIGGQVSLAGNGDILVYGSLHGVTNRVGVLQWVAQDQGTPLWQPLGQVLLGGDSSQSFGASVQLNQIGTRLVVGAPGSIAAIVDGQGPIYGKVYVYDFNAGLDLWELISSKPLQSDEADDGFGTAVACDGTGRRIVTSLPLRPSTKNRGTATPNALPEMTGAVGIYNISG